jgi:transcriptional regulator with XRE-family HTH domain
LYRLSKALEVWVEAELQARNWSRRELARRIARSRLTVEYIELSIDRPTPDFCAQLADVFGLPVEQVYRLADLPTAGPEEAEVEQELVQLYRQLGDDDRARVLVAVRELVARAGQRR